MSHHLKRLAAPKSWKINRKSSIFTAKPTPGTHPGAMALPLLVCIRDMLGYACTAAETKKLLQETEVLVDGVRRREGHFAVGLFDVVSFPKANLHYRVVLDAKGRLHLCGIAAAEAGVKLCRVTGKTMVAGGRIQYHLHDGRNILSTKEAAVGDTIVLQLPALDVKEILPLRSGMAALLIDGKHSGELGIIRKIAAGEAIYLREGKEVGTARRYLFVVGEKTPMITLA